MKMRLLNNLIIIVSKYFKLLLQEEIIDNTPN